LHLGRGGELLWDRSGQRVDRDQWLRPTGSTARSPSSAEPRAADCRERWALGVPSLTVVREGWTRWPGCRPGRRLHRERMTTPGCSTPAGSRSGRPARGERRHFGGQRRFSSPVAPRRDDADRGWRAAPWAGSPAGARRCR
jgi:hypothetical protein